jgi:hypothetical protein
VGFFFHDPRRVAKVAPLFRPPLWGDELFDAVGHTGDDPLTDAQRRQVQRPWCEVLDEVLSKLTLPEDDALRTRRVWHELADGGPWLEVAPPCERHGWSLEACDCKRGGRVRHRFGNVLVPCLQDLELTERRLRDVVEARSGTPPAGLAALVAVVDDDAELRAAMEHEVGAPLATELWGHVRDAVRDDNAATVVHAAKLCARLGRPWTTARCTARRMTTYSRPESGIGRSDFLELNPDGFTARRDDDGEPIRIERCCDQDVRAWRALLQTGCRNRGDAVRQLFHLFRGYQKAHTREAPALGVVEIDRCSEVADVPGVLWCFVRTRDGVSARIPVLERFVEQ